MPRKEKGSSSRPSTIASTCGSGFCGMLAPLGPGQNPKDPLEGNIDPAGPVRQFVRHLVDGLFEYEECCHQARLLLAHRISRAAAHRLAIGGAKAVDRPLSPGFGELRHSWLRRRPRLRKVPHRGDGGIVERTNHSGDISQGRALAPTRSKRPYRLALEIDNKEVVLNDDHLA